MMALLPGQLLRLLLFQHKLNQVSQAENTRHFGIHLQSSHYLLTSSDTGLKTKFQTERVGNSFTPDFFHDKALASDLR